MLHAVQVISLPADCPELISISAIAQNYGQLTGVLAGFAFTALVLLLSSGRAPGGRSRDQLTDGVPLVLFIAFITLIINTIMYAVLAGDTDEIARPRAASVEIVDGVSFSLSVLLLFQGIALLVRGAQLDRATLGAARFITVAVTPSIAMYFVAAGTTDSESARAQLNGICKSSNAPLEGVALSVGILILLSLSLISRVQRIAENLGPTTMVAAPLTVLLTTIGGAVVSTDMGTRSPQFLFSLTATSWWLRGTFAVLLAVGLMLSLSGSAPTGKSEPFRAALVVRQRRPRVPRPKDRRRTQTVAWLAATKPAGTPATNDQRTLESPGLPQATTQH
jgi:hypothetical protein